MKIGIIIHSYTGHTWSVAEKLRDELMQKGHTVNLERVSAFDENPSAVKDIQLQSAPSLEEYEAVFFGAPVRGLCLSPVMKAYLSGIPSLQGKKVGCFVTQAFPFPWMGGNKSVLEMKKLAEDKGAHAIGTGVVNWSSTKKEKQIEQWIEKSMQI